jgi:hypothetical protein
MNSRQSRDRQSMGTAPIFAYDSKIYQVHSAGCEIAREAVEIIFGGLNFHCVSNIPDCEEGSLPGCPAAPASHNAWR